MSLEVFMIMMNIQLQKSSAREWESIKIFIEHQ